MSLKRRKFFILYLLALAVVLNAVSILWIRFVPGHPAFDTMKHIVFFFITVFGVLLCFETTFLTALFCEIGAYATQHFAYKAGELFQKLFQGGLDRITSAGLVITVDLIVFILAYFIFARRIKRGEANRIENKQIIALSTTVLLFAVVFQFVFNPYAATVESALFIIIAFYDLLCCIFTLCIQYGLFIGEKMRQDYKVMEHLLHQQKAQLAASKDTIDIINIKCHDMKQRISAFGKKFSDEEYEELERIISIYDSALKTGNEALDVILAEKSLACERKKIKMECIADGGSLGFMASSDIYSLFGNSIDNAIEAVEAIGEIEKRIISISVKKSLGMVIAHFENYYSGELSFENELPLTTKGDKQYHGFGMRSIQLIVDKYKGNMAVSSDKGIFNLNILFPL
jgi:hypothetical protein